MPNAYALNSGTYFVGDLGLITKKTSEATLWIEKIWALFYKDMNQFYHLTVDGISLYLCRTAEGDGYFNDIGTDTGTISIIEVTQLKGDDRFKDYQNLKGYHLLETQEMMIVKMENFNLYFENGYKIITDGSNLDQ